ncbi:hypothetical protein EDC04DRAFT_2822958 [Pisolithus marmoratus]|nr:hypothetical protein EDC04DRAFT_2822958 [Pisolithus marmoratus]
MSDVRSLLKAKRQEARVNHPLAAYSSSGQLRCVVCTTSVKHAAAWQGHLGSKEHRINAARIREDGIGKQQGQQQDLIGKETLQGAKRKADEPEWAADVDGASQKRRKAKPGVVTDTTNASTSLENLPVDFFPDSSYVPPSPDVSYDGGTPISLSGIKPASPVDPALDEEWIRFQKDVLNAPDHREAYDRATVVSEPQLISQVDEGFPKQSQSEEGRVQQSEVAFQSDEETMRQRKEREERELILDRLVEEERAQEEADMRVSVMKNRLEAVRRKRMAIRSAKPK